MIRSICRARASTKQERARKLVAAVRGKRAHASGGDELMCLAEALLRNPARETANRLIRDR